MTEAVEPDTTETETSAETADEATEAAVEEDEGEHDA